MTRLLVVEDDPDILQLISVRLQHAGYAVRAVGDAASALASASEGAVPDVLVLDIGLPDMDGFALLEQLRQRPGFETVPAIFLTARVEERDVRHGLDMGAAYLTKPFVTSALLDKVRRAESSKQAPAPISW